MKRWKVEFVGDTVFRPFWFDTREEVDEFIRFNKGIHVDDVPGNRVKLRITEYVETKTEVV